ncbi:lipopolysaccharide biosynthesis protein [Blautia sp. HCP3S3_H10_1]|uniref:lipopolysaccharide biosynthesis protein n=1 Tax=unclassified Blautia TaxID=2648079 RepID=UPI003F930743|nr:lipopolysaccharide biosynthesis protein [Clostridia bacterium]
MNKEKNVKKAFLWNMIGSTCYSGSSFLYLLVVTRICGAQLAGFYSLSYATAQLLLQVGRYGVRTYQATDLNRKYSFSEYKLSRLITCALMMLFGIVYSSYSFSGEYIIISIFIIMMKMIDAVEDVFHGNLQQKYHVEQMGKSLAIRNIYSAVFFTGVLIITKSLYITCVATAITSLILCLAVNTWFSGRYGTLGEKQGSPALSHVWELLKICTPMFVGTFLSLLLYNVPKYAMAGVMTDEYQTYYSILFMPSFVITLMCEFVFKPTITTIAELWWENNIKKFVTYVLRIIGIILVCCVGIVIGGHLIGRTLLEIIYGVDLSPFKLQFIVLLVGGGISAEVYMLYNILIAIRWGKCLLPVYSITAVLTIAVARTMVKQWGIMGAALNYLLSCSILFILFTGILVFVILKKKGQKNTAQ